MWGFKERLEGLRAQNEVQAKTTSKEAERIAIVAGLTEQLVEIAEESLLPTLEAVNDGLLSGRGEISLKRPNPREVFKRGGIPKVSVELLWDEFNMTDGLRNVWGGNRLILSLRGKSTIEVQGASYGTRGVTVDRSQEDWQERLEKTIYSFLYHSELCRWEVDYYDLP